MSKSIEKNIASVNMGVDEFTTGLKQLALITADAVNHKHIQDRSLEFFGTATPNNLFYNLTLIDSTAMSI